MFRCVEPRVFLIENLNEPQRYDDQNDVVSSEIVFVPGFSAFGFWFLSLLGFI